jgi:hypothetical protein
VIPFNQPEDTCAAYVAWWIRARLQQKLFSRRKYFDRQHDLAKYDPGAGYSDALEGMLVTGERGASKAQALQANLARAGREAIQAYITRGVRKDKEDRAWKEVADNVKSVQTTTVFHLRLPESLPGTWGLAPGLGRSFEEVARGRLAAHYSLVMRGAKSHAVGLDCTEDVRYFDPNLGEFRFPIVGALCWWWEWCLVETNNPNGDRKRNAFARFGNNFCAEYYTPVAAQRLHTLPETNSPPPPCVAAEPVC